MTKIIFRTEDISLAHCLLSKILIDRDYYKNVAAANYIATQPSLFYSYRQFSYKFHCRLL